MARLLAFAALAGIAWASTAAAGDVYVCKGPNGVNSYQNVPCANASAQLRHQTYSQSLARQPAAPAVAAPYNYRPTHAARPAPEQNTYAPAPEPPAGFECVAGHRRWVQASPCPATYQKSSPVDVDGFDQYGVAIHGSGWVDQQAPVKEHQLDRDALCDKVRSGASLGHGWSASRESYERNKLRDRFGCGA